jgi:hypothetical protein
MKRTSQYRIDVTVLPHFPRRFAVFNKEFSAGILKHPVHNTVNQTTLNRVYETPHAVIHNAYIFERHLITLCTVIRVKCLNSSVGSAAQQSGNFKSYTIGLTAKRGKEQSTCFSTITFWEWGIIYLS